MLQEFKKFILRGNVVDLAVAVVIGAAFTAVVSAFVEDFLTPLIAAIQGDREFSTYVLRLNGIDLRYGDFLNKLLTFLLTAAVVFFLVVQPLNRLVELGKRHRKGDASAAPTTKACPECLSEVPVMASRCKFCTSRFKATADIR